MTISPTCGSLANPQDTTSTEWRVVAAGVILVVSATASSFPTWVKRIPSLEPPDVVFFIGKHFGTGVILSTAFVHLLQEAFENLNNPCLDGQWKDWTGLLVLSSFISIFLIEYISTAYVERMSKGHSYDHHHHDPMINEPYHDVPSEEVLIEVHDEVERLDQTPPPAVIIDEHQQDPPSRGHRLPRFWRRHTNISGIGHHRHESPSAHHHRVGPRLEQRQHIPVLYVPESVPSQGNAQPHLNGNASEMDHAVSRKSRIIGILVLQLGIMIHSVVIGLTLSITEGANFTTLFTAVIFHQLFEGLSLGIRISTLPSGSRRTRFLPVILCTLFAITAPLGVLLGIGVLPTTSNDESSDELQRSLLTKGLMCALSAGMLIYAAAVEMIAGDFVMSSEMRQLNVRKQALGLTSLVLGTAAMAVVGLWS